MVNSADIKEAWGQLNNEATPENTETTETSNNEDAEIVEEKENDSEDDVSLIQEDEEKTGTEQTEEDEKESNEEGSEKENEEEGVVDINEDKIDISSIDISEKTGGEFSTIDELLESYSSLKEKTQPIENVFEYLDQQSEEKIGLSFAELMEYKSMDFDSMNEFDVISEYQQMKDPDISEIEIQAELKQFDVLRKTDAEIQEMIENEELTQSEYDLTLAKFNKTVRTARRELNEYRESLDLNNIELPVSISQGDKPMQFTEEDIENNAKVISEELKSFKTLRLRLGSKDGEDNLDFKIADDEKELMVNTIKNPKWLADRWTGKDGQTDKTKAYRDAYVLMNFNKMIKSAYNEGVAKGAKKSVVEEDNISLKGKSKPTQTSKTDPMVAAVQKWESQYGGF